MSDLNETLRPWIQEYNEEVRSLAREYLKQPEESRDEWLWETIDGHEWIIYTWKARCVLVASDSPDSQEGETGERGTVEQEAFYAMRSDVQAMASAMIDEGVR